MLKKSCEYPKLDTVNINAYIKYGENLSICSQDNERKQNYEGRKDEQIDRQPKSFIAPLFQSRAIKMHLKKVVCYFLRTSVAPKFIFHFGIQTNSVDPKGAVLCGYTHVARVIEDELKDGALSVRANL